MENCGTIPFSHNICITNATNGENVTYSLVLFKGYVTCSVENCQCSHNQVLFKQLNRNAACITTECRTVRMRFKCLLHLARGTNVLSIHFEDHKFDFVINFNARETPFSVLPVYIICENHDGKFQAPENIDNSIESACERIALGAQLIQCVCAEKMFEAKMGRKTFQLENDISDNAPRCVIFRSALNVHEARAMKQDDLWEYFARELMNSKLGSYNRKFLAFLSCTLYKYSSVIARHDAVISQTEAYIARGGGGLALFGTACLYTWPSSISEIVPCFLNDTSVDTTKFMDDSCYRGTVGGCFATTLGSVLHELGHAFDLGHSAEGIMSRGFDNINRIFTFHSNEHVIKTGSKNFVVTLNNATKPSKPELKFYKTCDTNIANNNLQMYNDSCHTRFQNCTKLDSTFWSESCAVLLAYHRWFNHQSSDEVQGNLMYDSERNSVVSSVGIRVVEIREDSGLIMDSWTFTKRPIEVFPVPRLSVEDRTLTLVVEDSSGNIVKLNLSQLTNKMGL